MTAPAVTFTAGTAREYNSTYGTTVRRLSRMSAVALRIEERRLMAEQGSERLSGKLSKDELVSSVLALRGYTTERLSEAIHVLHHKPGVTGSTACQWCCCQVTWTDGDGFLRQCGEAPGHGGDLHRNGQCFYARVPAGAVTP